MFYKYIFKLNTKFEFIFYGIIICKIYVIIWYCWIIFVNYKIWYIIGMDNSKLLKGYVKGIKYYIII